MADKEFDCVIAGGGHAGCEAAVTLGRLGLSVLLISGNLDRLGYLSCNPAIGGLAKGHMTREIDALGGQMGLWADAAAIQFRILNMSKGPAVRATRAQMDRNAYSRAVKKTLYSTSGLQIWQDNVTAITTSNGRASGVKTLLGLTFKARNVLVTTGTFLRGLIHIGPVHLPAGRMGDAAAQDLSFSLEELGFALGRLKTGTTPRLLRSSIDFSQLEEQKGHTPMPQFSFHGPLPPLRQTSCHITWTNLRTHEIIRSGFDRSPLFTGVIEGTGARYCPSIEDKVARFPDRDRHHVFLEPEGLDSGEIYCNGISTSLPLDIQIDMIHSIKGLGNAQMARPGYAIEYDYANPLQLWPTLETKKVPGLWFAGQINGTSGYEEAAGQGLWAALNIACRHMDKPPFSPGREKSYIAVMIDDLVTLGTEEPYRMFTSRAEHRLLLREDNADSRLTPLGRELGLVGESQWRQYCEAEENAERLRQELRGWRIPPVVGKISGEGEKSGCALSGMATDVLRRPDVTLDDLENFVDNSRQPGLKAALLGCGKTVRGKVETEIKYAGYLERQAALAARSAAMDSVVLPPDLDYAKIAGLSREIEEKLTRIRPASIGQAGRISGVTPAALGCLEIHLHKLGLLRPQGRQ